MKLRRLLPLLLLSGCTGNLAGPPAPCATKDGAEVLATRCLTCHSVTLTGTARSGATAGVDFDTEADVRRWVDRIRQRTFVDKTMPPGLPLAECESTQLDAHLTALATGTCTPSCSGRACGSDGCGGQCGSCAPTENCDAAGQCSPAVSCSPDCTGRSCGDDGCGGSCGTCGPGTACSATGQCVCGPQCTNRVCGSDGCGGSCGACTAPDVCSATGACTCVPSCGGKACGADGCGGSCGTCASPTTCNASNACVCVPNCTGKQCGPDGCGGSCGSCTTGMLTSCNTQTGRCVAQCTGSCTGRACGDDGCGGSCGTCASGQACTTAGACVCQPSCAGKACGDDGCGGSCGSCASGLACSTSGQCGCTPSCTGKLCGDDGCGGSCGTCASGQTCSQSGQCGCVPSCSGKQCGDDGCGGSCGTCSGGATCSSGACTVTARSYATDVHPIWVRQGCAGSGCHASTRPAEGLDLSSASAGYADLVDQPSGQCSSRMRVKRNDVAGSYLVNKLLGAGMCFGSQMPKAGGGLSAAELDIVRAWILSNAPP